MPRNMVDMGMSLATPCMTYTFMPTGGVEPTEESIGGWVKAGAACLGMGSKLIKNDLVEKKDWPELSVSVAKGIDLVKKARQVSETI